MAKTTTRFTTKNDLSEETRSTVIELLNQQLADITDLYTQTKQAHWNVKGPNFQQLHELLDMLAATLLPHIDIVAERAVILGGVAMGTVRMAAESSQLEPYDNEVHEGMDVVDMVAERYATAAAGAREAIDRSDEAGDMDTADLFTALSRDLDKSLWFLEAHLQS